jgi:hypothetical protein
MTVAKEATRRARANHDLAKKIGSTYWSHLPVADIAEIINKHGFDGSALDGIYTGHQGKVHEKVGKNTWIVVTWYRMPSGNFEIIAYLS